MELMQSGKQVARLAKFVKFFIFLKEYQNGK